MTILESLMQIIVGIFEDVFRIMLPWMIFSFTVLTLYSRTMYYQPLAQKLKDFRTRLVYSLIMSGILTLAVPVTRMILR